jgi:hypothetical protein
MSVLLYVKLCHREIFLNEKGVQIVFSPAFLSNIRTHAHNETTNSDSYMCKEQARNHNIYFQDNQNTFTKDTSLYSRAIDTN